MALRRGDHSAERLKLEREQLEIDKEQLEVMKKKQRELTANDHWEWAKENVDCICNGYVSTKQKIGALHRHLFGFDMDDEGHEEAGPPAGSN